MNAFCKFSYLILCKINSFRNNTDLSNTNMGDGSTTWSRQQNAVSVRHAFKSYGGKSKRNQVLSNLNMTVAKGTMYDN